jgi:aspartyl-tRNA(Asn)/glutamyl-tRNA(Gln) amidotransferase subunit C
MKKKKELTAEEVRHIAALAKLELTSEELKKYQKQLTKIFDYIDQIGEMKIEKEKEISHPSGATNAFREDKIATSQMLTQDQALSNAATKKKNGYFKVRAIFGQ